MQKKKQLTIAGAPVGGGQGRWAWARPRADWGGARRWRGEGAPDARSCQRPLSQGRLAGCTLPPGEGLQGTWAAVRRGAMKAVRCFLGREERSSERGQAGGIDSSTFRTRASTRCSPARKFLEVASEVSPGGGSGPWRKQLSSQAASGYREPPKPPGPPRRGLGKMIPVSPWRAA